MFHRLAWQDTCPTMIPQPPAMPRYATQGDSDRGSAHGSLPSPDHICVCNSCIGPMCHMYELLAVTTPRAIIRQTPSLPRRPREYHRRTAPSCAAKCGLAPSLGTPKCVPAQMFNISHLAAASTNHLGTAAYALCSLEQNTSDVSSTITAPILLGRGLVPPRTRASHSPSA